uniref:BRO1 domain-containing protein n=1 Tax=Chenopodium quinoa TaxID=63459 RepID=A0A803MUF7_CHEQI
MGWEAGGSRTSPAVSSGNKEDPVSELASGGGEATGTTTTMAVSRRASVDIFLKAAGYLDCAVRHVFPQLSAEMRRNLPVDLAEGVIRALSLQALGQGVDIQLGMAIDSAKATLAVKRRLACEMVKYWQQAQDNIMNLPLSNGWGEKHQLFVKWKYVEAKAAAYYYHGLILDEGNTEKSHGMAIAALQAADEYLKESKKACEAFNMAPPQSRIMETAPTLPDFALALKPDEYQLPPVHSCWSGENTNSVELGAK